MIITIEDVSLEDSNVITWVNSTREGINALIPYQRNTR
jgi:hypothetical protein